MISKYKDNMQKYNEIIDYINSHPNMPEDLRKEILNLIQKFKVMIFCAGEKETYDLIDLSIKEGNTESLKKHLDITTFGRKRDYYKYAKLRNDRKDEKYNLD